MQKNIQSWHNKSKLNCPMKMQVYVVRVEVISTDRNKRSCTCDVCIS